MSQPPTVHTVLDQQYLPTRAKILEIAAVLDRLDRSAGEADPRADLLRSALQIVLENSPERAARVQLLLSRPYDEHWTTALELPRR